MCKEGVITLFIILWWEMDDSENFSNSPMVTELAFKPISLTTWEFHKDGKNEENFTENRVLAFHRAAHGFPSFRYPSLSPWTSAESNHSFSWEILHFQWEVEMYGVKLGLKMTEILFIKQVPGILNIMHYTKLHNILYIKTSQNVNSIYVEKHWSRYF